MILSSLGNLRCHRTISTSISVRGIAAHSGEQIHMTCCPAELGHGIQFQRTDLPGQPVIPAYIDSVVDGRFCTTLCHDGVQISTVEHVLSALYALGITNVLIAVDGGEMPIMDGSSQPFVFMLQSAGVVDQNDYVSYLCVTQPVVVCSERLGEVSLQPISDGVDYRLDVRLSYDHPAWDDVMNVANFSFRHDVYYSHLARARTYGFLSDLAPMQAMGLAKGVSLETSIGFDEQQVMNAGGLRYPNEPARHKLLDAIGDLSLAGHRLIAHYQGFCPGHALNHQLVRELLKNSHCYEIIDAKSLARQAS